MKFAVLGAGSAGQGIAGYLALKGHDLFLYNRTPERIASLAGSRRLKVSGILEGEAAIQAASCDLETVVSNVPYVLVTARAGGHESLVEQSLPYLQEHAVIVVFTGYWAALRLQHLLRESDRTDVTIAETTLLPLACRVVEPGHVRISGEKSTVRMATYPPDRLNSVYEKLHAYVPQLVPGRSVLETSLENYNPVIHVPIALFNMNRVEEDSETFWFYSEGISPRVARAVDAADSERLALCHTLGLDLKSAATMIQDYYAVKGETTYQTIKNWEAVREYVLPDPLSYVREELIYGLVPLVSLCDMLKIPAPGARMLVGAWSVVDGTDYWERGVTCERLGLSGMAPEEIVDMVSRRKNDV
ncbi:MAG: NAD/NADP octopine/nopaline dehydrogenase family protein [Theionarchaea archaeon]|nr:NAD/NADP octopine/nopaline dehydrogenase family protein [Theionarchaea archaeon]